MFQNKEKKEEEPQKNNKKEYEKPLITRYSRLKKTATTSVTASVSL